MESIKIPIGVSICVDDVGWHLGEDERAFGGPARSALPRRHHPSDVRVLHEIGKGLGVKILCDLVLGEWDKNNRLRRAPYLTWGSGEWNAAAGIDYAFAEEYFAALEESEYLEYGMHTPTHDYFVDGRIAGGGCIYPRIGKNEWGGTVRIPLPPEKIDEIFSLFYEIYDDWGFKKKIRTWQTPCGGIGVPSSDFNLEIARVARRYGLTVWEWAGWPNIVEVHEGMIYPSAVLGGFLPWNACAVDPSILHNCFEAGPRPGIRPNICGHLTNFIHYQPEKNFEYVSAWVEYFRRVTSPCGVMLATDNEDSASQAVYAEHAITERVDGGYRIDLSRVDAIRADALKDEFFLSLRTSADPKAVTGASLSLHERRADHTVYLVKRHVGAAEILLTM